MPVYWGAVFHQQETILDISATVESIVSIEFETQKEKE
jgi:hypothetical protein